MPISNENKEQISIIFKNSTIDTEGTRYSFGVRASNRFKSFGNQYILSKDSRDNQGIELNVVKIESVKDLYRKSSDKIISELEKLQTTKLSNRFSRDNKHDIPKLKERLQRLNNFERNQMMILNGNRVSIIGNKPIPISENRTISMLESTIKCSKINANNSVKTDIAL